jgi:hypothetical protein
MPSKIISRICICSIAVVLAGLTACSPADTSNESEQGPRFKMVGKLEHEKLDEASGIAPGDNGVFFLHNDGKDHLYAIDSAGRNLGRMKVKDARNRDWEDITRVMDEDSPLLVIGDTGDNMATRNKVRLYFIEEPGPDDFNGKVRPVHKLDIRYPDGPRDVESIAWDPHSDMILLLSKRDVPPRLYGVPRDLALVEQELEADFLGEIHPLPPPTRTDIVYSPKRGLWVSQPTAMDISSDASLAAILTYRSLYLYERQEHESWLDAFQRKPAEFKGPPGLHDEAVAFTTDRKSVYVATERRPAPLHRLDLDETVFRDLRREIPAKP